MPRWAACTFIVVTTMLGCLALSMADVAQPPQRPLTGVHNVVRGLRHGIDEPPTLSLKEVLALPRLPDEGRLSRDAYSKMRQNRRHQGLDLNAYDLRVNQGSGVSGGQASPEFPSQHVQTDPDELLHNQAIRRDAKQGQAGRPMKLTAQKSIATRRTAPEFEVDREAREPGTRAALASA